MTREEAIQIWRNVALPRAIAGVIERGCPPEEAERVGREMAEDDIDGFIALGIFKPAAALGE